MVEHGTHNSGVVGSNPTGRTKYYMYCGYGGMAYTENSKFSTEKCESSNLSIRTRWSVVRVGRRSLPAKQVYTYKCI